MGTMKKVKKSIDDSFYLSEERAFHYGPRNRFKELWFTFKAQSFYTCISETALYRALRYRFWFGEVRSNESVLPKG